MIFPQALIPELPVNGWFTIPTQIAIPWYTMRTRLDGQDYNLEFKWNEREARWYMSFFNDTGDTLMSDIKIISNWPLTRGVFPSVGMPPGLLMAIDLSGDRSPPDFYDLAPGKRCELSYAPVNPSNVVLV